MTYGSIKGNLIDFCCVTLSKKAENCPMWVEMMRRICGSDLKVLMRNTSTPKSAFCRLSPKECQDFQREK